MGMSPRALLLGLLLTLCCGVSGLAQRTFFFPQIGDGVFANIQFQTTLVFVNTGAAVTVQVEFLSSPAGTPLQVTLGDQGTDDTFMIDLPEGGSVSLQTPGQDGLVVGYARVTDPRPHSPGQALLGGTAVFTRTDVTSGVVLYEAGVPATEGLNNFTLFVDSLEDLDTGLAMVNVEEVAAAANSLSDVTLSLFDTAFQLIATTIIPFNTGQHSSRFIFEYFDAVPQAKEMQGTVVGESPDAQLAAVTLRQMDMPGVEFPDEVPTLTTFPVVDGAAPSALAGSFTSLDSDRLAVTIQVPDLTWVRQIRMSFMSGDNELSSLERQAAAGRTLSDIFVFPGRSESIDRIEFELTGKDGNRVQYTLIH